MEKSFFDYQVQDAAHHTVSLSTFADKVVVVVNVASKCGFTPQYAGLEDLYQHFKDKPFTIIGFPCNQFGAQEPGSDSEIQQFCSMNYGVSFPVMAKVDVNGSNTAPVYEFLKSNAPGLLGTEMVKWNFTKFLIGKDGQVLQRYAPQTEPKALAGDIEKALHT